MIKMKTSVFILLSIRKHLSQIDHELERGNSVHIITPCDADVSIEQFTEERGEWTSVVTNVRIKDLTALRLALPNSKKSIEFVFAFEEYCLLPAAYLREQLGIYGRKPNQVICFRNKEAMVRSLFAKSPKDVKIPHTERFTGEDQVFAFLSRYNKVIAKRIDGMGSKDIQIFSRDQTRDEVIALVRRMRKGKTYILQEFIEGHVYHYDTYILGGEPIIDNLMEYIEYQCNYKSNKSLTALSVPQCPARNKLVSAAHEVIRLYELNEVTIHLELIYDGTSVFFCEIGIRPGGAGVVPAVEALYGVDLFEIDYLFQANRSDEVRRCAVEAVELAGWSVIYPTHGIVTKIRGLEELRREKQIKLLSCSIAVGDELADQQHCASAVLLAVYTAQTHEQLKKIYTTVYNVFSYDVI